jgi:hypothetical protein
MRFTDRLSLAQRIVVVVALGFAFAAIGSFLDNLGTTLGTGWIGYAPLSRAPFLWDAGLPDWLQLLLWFVLIGLWALAAIRVLRPVPEEPPAAGQP